MICDLNFVIEGFTVVNAKAALKDAHPCHFFDYVHPVRWDHALGELAHRLFRALLLLFDYLLPAVGRGFQVLQELVIGLRLVLEVTEVRFVTDQVLSASYTGFHF